MSLRSDETEETMLPFPANKNIRVKITGLALCEFTPSLSTVRFLRHVKHHELLMKITQMKLDLSGKKTFTVKIGPAQNVEISASTLTTVTDYIHPPTVPEESFNHIVKMRTLHDNRTLEDKPNMPRILPTMLKLNHCVFYTHKLTDKNFKFEDIDGTPKPDPSPLCEVLGGYLEYGGNLTISILNDGIPLTFPLANFLYEIEFSNSCDTSPGCRDEEDFRFMYDVVREQGNYGRVFKLIEVEDGTRAINTGACLPVCRNC